MINIIENFLQIFPFIALSLSSSAFLVVLYDTVKKLIQRRHKQQEIKRLDNETLGRHKHVLPKAANIWMFKLISYATELNPDCIVGINRGGSMLGAYLALGLDIPSDRFIPCYVDPDKPYVKCEISSLKGVILIVDDICRTGKTMIKALKYIEDNKSKHINHIYSSVLVCTLDTASKPVCNISYCSYVTHHKDIKLPWTPEKEEEEDGIEKTSIFTEMEHQPIEHLAREFSANLHESSTEL